MNRLEERVITTRYGIHFIIDIYQSSGLPSGRCEIIDGLTTKSFSLRHKNVFMVLDIGYTHFNYSRHNPASYRGYKGYSSRIDDLTSI